MSDESAWVVFHFEGTSFHFDYDKFLQYDNTQKYVNNATTSK